MYIYISDRYATLFLEIYDKMAAFGHFGCPKFTLDRISGHFRSIGHFGFQKLTNKTNDIVKTEHMQLKHGIHSRRSDPSREVLSHCMTVYFW